MLSIQEVFDLAAKYHKDSKPHSNGFPYTHHLESCRFIAETLGYNSTIQAACLLHDVLEDTDATPESLLEDGVCPNVIEIVKLVTDPAEGSRKEKKAAMYERLCEATAFRTHAAVVKTIDRIHNTSVSKNYNTRLLDMYKKEYTEFCANVLTHLSIDDEFSISIKLGSMLRVVSE